MKEREKEKEFELKLRIEQEQILNIAKQETFQARKELSDLKATVFGIESIINKEDEASIYKRNSELEIEIMELRV